jgi:hypothetical protein
MKRDTYREPERSIPVYGYFDVVVVGGGTAGIAAAVAAARNGASVLIVERFAFFGGAATTSLMAKINGFRNQVEPDGVQTTKGIGEEVILKLIAEGGTGAPIYKKMKRYAGTKGELSFSYVVDTERLKYVLLKLVVDSGVRILFHTYFSDAVVQDGRVAGIIVENKSGRQLIRGKVFVDASGDGDLAFRAGAPFHGKENFENVKLQDTLMFKILVREKEIDYFGCRFDDTMVLWGPKAGPIDATDADQLSQGEVKTRLAVYEHLAAETAKCPGLAGSIVVETPAMIGVKQTRFIEGLYTITGDDVLEGRKFDDSIAMASKPIIEYYGYRRYLEHDGYEIPYRCLLPKELDGLLVAGRCISSDQPAFESWRSMAPCMSLGEAAGTAAALCAKFGVQPKALDVKTLQARLIEQGAEIGRRDER